MRQPGVTLVKEGVSRISLRYEGLAFVGEGRSRSGALGGRQAGLLHLAPCRREASPAPRPSAMPCREPALLDRGWEPGREGSGGCRLAGVGGRGSLPAPPVGSDIPAGSEVPPADPLDPNSPEREHRGLLPSRKVQNTPRDTLLSRFPVSPCHPGSLGAGRCKTKQLLPVGPLLCEEHA